jgi:hypothetical protein
MWCTEASLSPIETKDSDEPFLGGGWMGSLANLLMRTLLNVTIKVNNIVVKYKTPTTVATLTCESLHVTTADDLRLENSKVGQATLTASVPDCRKVCRSLHARQSTGFGKVCVIVFVFPGRKELAQEGCRAHEPQSLAREPCCDKRPCSISAAPL